MFWGIKFPVIFEGICDFGCEKFQNTNGLAVCGTRNDGDENEKNPCKVPVFMDCGIGNCATEYVSARNIRHLVVIPRDVLFCHVFGSFCGRHYWCISSFVVNLLKTTITIYITCFCDANFSLLPLEKQL